MTQAELFQLLKSTGYPVAYNQFKKPQKAPFIAYVNTGRDIIGADDAAWVKTNSYRVELYTEGKDLDAENALETVLDRAGIIWSMSEVGLIESEGIYENYYEFEL